MEATKLATEEGSEVMEIPAPVSASYCLKQESQLTVRHKVLSVPCGRFTIKDDAGTLLFDVKCKDPFAFHKKRVLIDESGQPQLLLKSKCPSLYCEWAVYRGDDDETDSKLLFTIKKSAIFHCTPSFHVFLPKNTDASNPDFTVEGTFMHTSYTVLYKDNPIAKAKRIAFSTKHILTIYPGADRAFISALMIVLYSQCGAH